MTESPEALPQPTTTLSLPANPGKTPSEAIYQFDQEMARRGVPYHAGLQGGRTESAFTILVPAEAAAEVQRVIDLLQPPLARVPPTRIRGWWYAIEPARLSKTHKDHPWMFAVYTEDAADRGDGQQYTAFLFRNKERTLFGAQEWLGSHDQVTNAVLEQMAHRVVTDREYRRQLLTSDLDLIELWKRH